MSADALPEVLVGVAEADSGGHSHAVEGASAVTSTAAGKQSMHGTVCRTVGTSARHVAHRRCPVVRSALPWYLVVSLSAAWE